MSDDFAESGRLLEEAKNMQTGSPIENSRQLQALVHATRAVAEQQRIANVIAYRASLPDSAYDLVGRIDAQIREGMGLK